MTQTHGYQRFFAELKRRKVFRAAAVYGATGFVVLQVAELLAEGLQLSPAVLQTATVLVLIGFPIAIVLAWALELTPDGLKRTDDAEAGEIEAIVAQPAAQRWPAGLLALAGVAALVAGAWYVGRATAPDADPAAADAEAAAAAGATDADVLNLAYADLSEDRRPSIAVLPFADMSQEGDQEYFADGMTEEILNVLAKIRELRVAGRTSSFAYKDTNKDMREIGREMGVRYLVEGSVRKQGDQLRITAQLVDAADNFHVWTETYDRTLDDVFAVQSEIAEAIAEALEVSLGLGGTGGLITPTADLDAYDLYLTANARLRERGPGVAEAVALFEAAVARDSNWAPAWAGLAMAHSLAPYYVGIESDSARWATWESSLDAAESAALRALALDPENATAEVAIANVYRDRWDWEPALRHYVRALEIDPDNGEAHQQYAETLASVGRLDEALRGARRAVELDRTSSIRLNALGYILTFNGQPRAAIPILEQAIAQGPEFRNPYGNLANAHEMLGDFDRASEPRYRQIEFLIPAVDAQADRPGIRAFVDAYYGAMRARDAEALEACCGDVPIVIHQFADLGDPDAALDRLVASLEANPGYDSNLVVLLWYPSYDGLRSDPRFVAMARKVGLTGVEPKRDTGAN